MSTQAKASPRQIVPPHRLGLRSSLGRWPLLGRRKGKSCPPVSTCPHSGRGGKGILPRSGGRFCGLGDQTRSGRRNRLGMSLAWDGSTSNKKSLAVEGGGTRGKVRGKSFGNLSHCSGRISEARSLIWSFRNLCTFWACNLVFWPLFPSTICGNVMLTTSSPQQKCICVLRYYPVALAKMTVPEDGITVPG